MGLHFAQKSQFVVLEGIGSVASVIVAGTVCIIVVCLLNSGKRQDLLFSSSCSPAELCSHLGPGECR